jgi:hypothetical protein
MGCCGGRRFTSPVVSGASTHGKVQFEFAGPGQLTLYGRMSGKRYLFNGRGARVLVDARDAPGVRVVEGVQEVPSPIQA